MSYLLASIQRVRAEVRVHQHFGPFFKAPEDKRSPTTICGGRRGRRRETAGIPAERGGEKQSHNSRRERATSRRAAQTLHTPVAVRVGGHGRDRARGRGRHAQHLQDPGLQILHAAELVDRTADLDDGRSAFSLEDAVIGSVHGHDLNYSWDALNGGVKEIKDRGGCVSWLAFLNQ